LVQRTQFKTFCRELQLQSYAQGTSYGGAWNQWEPNAKAVRPVA